MTQYNSFKYVYPPRAEFKIRPGVVSKYDNGDFAAQVKYNGDCTIIFLNEVETHFFNRDNTPVTKKHNIDLRGIYSGRGWMIVCGEFMSKSKKDEHGNKLEGLVIWDLLAHGGQYLVNETFEARMFLLERLFPTQRMKVTPGGILEYKHLGFTNVQGVYKAPLYMGGFDSLYEDVAKVDAYEGLLLKKLNAKLDYGYNPNNNQPWQLKVRKSTKNYNH